MVEPLDLAHHTPSLGLPCLPQHLNSANVGSVRSARAQKHSTVIDVQDIFAPLDGLEEEFLGFPLTTWSLVTLPQPAPQLSALGTSQIVVLSPTR